MQRGNEVGTLVSHAEKQAALTDGVDGVAKAVDDADGGDALLKVFALRGISVAASDQNEDGESGDEKDVGDHRHEAQQQGRQKEVEWK